MARIILATIGSLGDLHPVIALALELRRRGHTAEIATTTIYREKLAALGFAFHSVRPELMAVDEALVRAIMDGPRGSEKLLRGLIFPAVRDMYADLARIVVGADLLVASELIYAAPLLAEQGRVRWVSYSLAPLSLFSISDPPVPPVATGGHVFRRLPPVLVRAMVGFARLTTRSWWAPLRALRRELGLPPGGNPLFAGKFSPRLDLALFSPLLGAPQPDWPARNVQTGFCFHDEEETASVLPPAIEAFRAAGPAPIVFTLGSAAVHAADDYFHESAAAAQALGRRALLVLGKNVPSPNLPPSILACDYLPYARIFPRAAVIVHQGGVGTTAQALRAGRPMLVVPWAHDQPDNAARVVRLGVARRLRRSRYTAARVAPELSALLTDPAIAVRAESVGAAIRAERGTTAACDAIERALNC
jgi:UDP:flavonoid glycosyltransferase YjiC (YdhE family)